MTTTYTVGAFTLTDKSLADRLTAFLAELPPEYHSYVVEDGPYGLQFCHPFCHVLSFDVLPVSNLVDTITSMSAIYEKNCANGDFESALYTVVKPYRRDYLLDLIYEHGVGSLYSAIRCVWVDVDWFWDYYDLWHEVWSRVQDSDDGRIQVISPEDRETFDALSDTLTVYRGFQWSEDGDGCEECGWSWSLSKETAEWFARRWPGGIPAVATVTVPKSAVLAYFNDRKEQEIVLMPDDLYGNTTVEELSRDGGDMIAESGA
ncbi:hypothetical protein SAMN04490248_103256 [Salinihabitans flavidus]|uniref:Uncharacterized protein n=1 Tax=Salinihabitans flavidus TaxID=569882 RepID=A0A1H8NM44_9RHOB|nr:hypothetical protein [Salinihabitans flavidus]SEO30589.1 hypothetical protein SAMN04490248_103256 [Salinihabitans flavidus]